jgi:hypothetical protein
MIGSRRDNDRKLPTAEKFARHDGAGAFITPLKALRVSPHDGQELDSLESRVTALERALFLVGALFVFYAGVTEIRFRQRRRPRR